MQKQIKCINIKFRVKKLFEEKMRFLKETALSSIKNKQ